MAKQVADEIPEETQGTEAVKTEKREILITVAEDGQYTLGFNGAFNVVELHDIVSTLNAQIRKDYRQFMEGIIFGMVNDGNRA